MKKRVRTEREKQIEALCESFESRGLIPENVLYGARDGTLAGLTPEQFKACLEALCKNGAK